MTDETVREWLTIHGREDAYENWNPQETPCMTV